ncbi:uncharacterized protein [Elaeis guineensis]|uniref:Uncharacterized protein LOC105061209 isoform X2 n=1 Tax=Elaeis guineensis var. tenera TaxID=51953 RepID=A0A6I9SIP8_ELAGV|nr:uncharacterized protein LOC105061209 isoform X2 [Elaeis guineensis]
MNCISYVSSAVLFSHRSHVIMRSSLYGFSSTSWKSGIQHAGIKLFKLDFILMGFCVQNFSTRRSQTLRLPKVKPQPSMEEESNAFYVVRKGDIIGVYNNLSACQAQVSSLVSDPSVSVYKGHSLHQETEEYLASRGLKNALYSMNAVDLKDDLFGILTPCPFRQPDGLASLVDKTPKKKSSRKRSKDMLNNLDAVRSTPIEQANKHLKLRNSNEYGSLGNLQRTTSKPRNQHVDMESTCISFEIVSCVLEFDGASKGNPGKAGAGAILRTEDGTVVSRLCEGLGDVTCNVAEYRALILGMKYALKKGFKLIRVQGDSNLVCMQVQDLWRTKNQNLANLCKEAKELKDMFLSFKISHVKREFNSDADAQANLAVDLPIGKVCEEPGELFDLPACEEPDEAS